MEGPQGHVGSHGPCTSALSMWSGSNIKCHCECSNVLEEKKTVDIYLVIIM